jgi:hypothetical protein
MYVQQGKGWQLLSCFVHFIKYLNVWTTDAEGSTVENMPNMASCPAYLEESVTAGAIFTVMGEGWQLVSCRVHCVQ